MPCGFRTVRRELLQQRRLPAARTTDDEDVRRGSHEAAQDLPGVGRLGDRHLAGVLVRFQHIPGDPERLYVTGSRLRVADRQGGQVRRYVDDPLHKPLVGHDADLTVRERRHILGRLVLDDQEPGVLRELGTEDLAAGRGEKLVQLFQAATEHDLHILGLQPDLPAEQLVDGALGQFEPLDRLVPQRRV